MSEIKIKVYTDPGHGWGAVKRDLLVKLGLVPHITSYSYQRGLTVYLEEDCDLPLLINSLKQLGITPNIEVHHNNNRSFIRSCDRFQP